MGIFHQSKESVPQQGESSKSYFVSKGEQDRRNDIWRQRLLKETLAPKPPGVEHWRDSFNHTIYENLDDREREEFWRTGDSYEKGWKAKETYLEKALAGWPPKQKQKDVIGKLLVMTTGKAGKGAHNGSDWCKWGEIIWPEDYDWTDSLERRIKKYIH